MRARWAGAVCAGALLFVLALVAGPWRAAPPADDLGPGRTIAPGVVLHHLTDSAWLDPPGPLSIWLLRLDLARADLRPVLANDQIMDTETVAGMATRHRAVAAINAGFFLPNGDPLGVLKIGGQLVSDARRTRGAMGIVRTGSPPRLIFDRLATRMALRIKPEDGAEVTIDIAGVDTTRLLGRLMLFTPVYHAHTDTAPGGLEWPVEGDPLRVQASPRQQGKTPIPRGGYVLSFGGRSPPAPLANLAPGTEVSIDTTFEPAQGSPEEWAQAHDIIGGAGLLARGGRYTEDWSGESFAAGFAEHRHPRTLVGTRDDGSVWLVAVDGRQPDLSVGLTLVELQTFARRLRLTDALNLDGGGSTTMWVDGHVVNSPSDAAGARPVSDALLVTSR